MTEVTLNQLVSKILEDARKQAKTVIDEAKQSSEKALEEKRRETQEKAQKACKEIIRSADADVENIVHRRSVEATIKARWILLSEKRKILDRVFQKVEDELQSFTKGDVYMHTLERLIEEAAMATGGGKLAVLLSRADSRRKLPLREISKRVSSRLGVETTLNTSERKISTIGGAVVQSTDERTRVDNTLGSILERERKNLEPKISTILFSE